MSGLLARAQRIDGHKRANLYNALDNLIDSATAALARCEDQHSHQAAALRGKLVAYRECRQLLVQTARYRPRIPGDPPIIAPQSD